MNYRYTLVFALGFLACAFLFYGFSYSNVEIPFATGLVSSDVSSPNDWIVNDDIIIFDDYIVLKIANATLSNYADSGSMKPVLDKGANGIRVVPESSEDIEIGDIISYRFGNMLIVHRVVDKGVDDEGVYFVMKGDNNLIADEKVRFDQIEYVTVGVIY